MRCIAISVSVCLSVSLSARISQKSHGQTLQSFRYLLPSPVARSSSDDNEICCVLPVLWMTSYFQIMGPNMAESKAMLCFVEFARWRHQGEVYCLR